MMQKEGLVKKKTKRELRANERMQVLVCWRSPTTVEMMAVWRA